MMTKNHRRWSEFINELQIIIDYEFFEGLIAELAKDETPKTDQEIFSIMDERHLKTCDCDPAMPKTHAVLAKMGFTKSEISATLEYLNADGVFSDNAVLEHEDKGVWPSSI